MGPSIKRSTRGKWMNSILQQMDDLVSNAAASYRLTEAPQSSFEWAKNAKSSAPSISRFK